MREISDNTWIESRLEALRREAESNSAKVMPYLLFGVFSSVNVMSSGEDIDKIMLRWKVTGISMGTPFLSNEYKWCVYSRQMNGPIWYPEVVEVPQVKTQSRLCVIMSDATLREVPTSDCLKKFIYEMGRMENLQENAYWISSKVAGAVADVCIICSALE